ncbi:hypothetical protein PVAP13_5NG507000 [Panicum virgatum]|uniref:Aspartate aminotransferase n=1 Tax=Panicum virgatum TaxID=38727 RepID=A0A8T0S5M5_PANVG|nr:hypothetical protein PVAP13_5NG507000 [Panicum virgatum]
MASQVASVFAGIAQAPEDPILGVTVAFNKDPSPVKVNLGVGAYRTEEGKPLVLNVVRCAEQMLINDPSRYKETYRYYDPATRGLDFNGLVEDLSSAPLGSIVLLHACAHNPTGVDPTVDQWEKIRQLMRSKSLLPFFDSAYQGFASGSLDKDAQPVRMFVADGGELLMAQSYAKNMGLYGERVGALSIVCGSADVAVRVESQLKLVIRPMYSSPPLHGPSVVATILRDSEMFNEWTVELKAMADRIISMRQQLFDALKSRGTPGDWSHIYMTSDGRISMAGLNMKNLPHLADAIHAAVTKLK